MINFVIFVYYFGLTNAIEILLILITFPFYLLVTNLTKRLSFNHTLVDIIPQLIQISNFRNDSILLISKLLLLKGIYCRATNLSNLLSSVGLCSSKVPTTLVKGRSKSLQRISTSKRF